MSFLDRSLPPSDRDDAPELPIALPDEQDEIGEAIEQDIILKIGRTLAEAQQFFAEYIVARERRNASGMAAAAMRLAANVTSAASNARRVERLARAARAVCSRKE